MDGIPQHTRLLVTRLLDAYCARICPPTARHAVQLAWRMGHDEVVLEEWRPILGIPGTRRAVPVARIRWSAREAAWTLEHAADARRFRRYPRLRGSRSFLELLREFDADPAGYFWGRLNGNSLRWCRPEGRCPGCEARYCGVLGLDPTTTVGGDRPAADRTSPQDLSLRPAR